MTPDDLLHPSTYGRIQLESGEPIEVGVRLRRGQLQSGRTLITFYTSDGRRRPTGGVQVKILEFFAGVPGDHGAVLGWKRSLTQQDARAILAWLDEKRREVEADDVAMGNG